MKKILVTGGNSYIGKHCIVQLLEKGYNVKTTVRSEKKAKDLNADLTTYLKHNRKVEHAITNLLNDDGWEEALYGIDAVFHVAGPYPMNAEGPEENHIKPHVEGTLRVLKVEKKIT